MLVVSGEEARKVFFGSKDLSMSEGYKVLFGGVRAGFFLLSFRMAMSLLVALLCRFPTSIR